MVRGQTHIGGFWELLRMSSSSSSDPNNPAAVAASTSSFTTTEAAAASSSSSSSAIPFPHIPPAEIDEGVFKYVLMRLSREGDGVRFIVRGSLSAHYHDDVFQASKAEILAHPDSKGLLVSCAGGGRIKHVVEEEKAGAAEGGEQRREEKKRRTIEVYGYSVGYGRAEHEVSAQVLRGAFPGAEVSWSNEGY